MNNITVTGNVGRDPELKYTAGNMAVLKFSIADTRGKDDKKHTSWHDVVVFGEQAETAANQLSKGSRVIVAGRIQVDNYEKKDGTKAKKVEILADEIGVSIRFTNDPVKSIAKTFDANIEEEEVF